MEQRFEEFIGTYGWVLKSMMLLLVALFIPGMGFMLAADAVAVEDNTTTATAGAAGLETETPGAATTASNVAEATGGIDGGNLIEPDIDEQLYKIGTDETVLLSMALKCRKVPATSPVVDHYMIDEQKSSTKVTAAYTAAQSAQAVLSVAASDQGYFQPYGTVIAKGVNGYTEDGKTAIPGKDLMLFVVGKDNATGNPIVRAINGPKTNTTDKNCTVPTIPVDSEIIFLSSALSETQKTVEPDNVIPTPNRIYLQKRGMNQVVSDYFDSQKKRIPFAEAIIAEALVKNFRRKCNRTLWIGQKGKISVNREGMGNQDIYFTEGLRWQFKRQYDHDSSTWTFDEFIALTKMLYTGQDCPSGSIFLVGKNLLENIQKIDFTKHHDITMTAATAYGFAVTKIHTVFGDLNIKHEPTFDYIGFSNSGCLIGDNALVRYSRKTEESSEEQIENEEAKRKIVLVWDGLALKGYCHIWVNGEDNSTDIPGTVRIITWDNATTAPTSPTLGEVVYLQQACTGVSATSKAGEMYRWNGTTWEKYTGNLYISQS